MRAFHRKNRIEHNDNQTETTQNTDDENTPARGIPFLALRCEGQHSKLIARLRFLEADCRYHAAICDPSPNLRHVALNVRHREERNEIMQGFAKVVPDCFDDAMALLEFAAWRVKSAAPLDDKSPLIAMFKSSAAGSMKAHVKLQVDHTLRRFEERQFAEVDA